MKTLLTFLIVLISLSAHAKKLATAIVNPITYQGIIYQTIPWAVANGTDQNGGFIAAVEVASGKVIWLRQLYKTSYTSGMERDAKDVFIESLELNSSKTGLIIKNENEQIFSLSLDGQLFQADK